MKTKLISALKKELLIIELPEGTDMKDPIQILKNKGNHLVYSKHNGHIISRNKLPDGEWNLLGKPDEIKEEDVSEFVKQSIFTSLYGHYVSGIDVNTYCYKTALDSFNSALESEIFWVNPLANEIHAPDIKEWKEAQEKTFDKKRTLIFVKN